MQFGKAREELVVIVAIIGDRKVAYERAPLAPLKDALRDELGLRHVLRDGAAEEDVVYSVRADDGGWGRGQVEAGRRDTLKGALGRRSAQKLVQRALPRGQSR